MQKAGRFLSYRRANEGPKALDTARFTLQTHPPANSLENALEGGETRDRPVSHHISASTGGVRMDREEDVLRRVNP